MGSKDALREAEDKVSQFEICEIKDRGTFFVQVTEPHSEPRRVGDFATATEAARWIAEQTLDWTRVVGRPTIARAMTSEARIGIDFDNTIIAYERVFCTAAKQCGLIGIRTLSAASKRCGIDPAIAGRRVGLATTSGTGLRKGNRRRDTHTRR